MTARADAYGPPMTPQQLRDRIRPRAAQSQQMRSLQHRFFVVSGTEAPRVEVRAVPMRSSRTDGLTEFEVVVELAGVRAGERAQHAPIHGKGFRRRLAPLKVAERERLLSPFMPEHLALSTAPLHFVEARKTIFAQLDDRVKRPTTIFAPDERRVFQDTSYPWGTVGLVETPHGTGSGVMIGPRHLLTVSHVIDWNVPPPFAANWVKFTPSSFDANEPFGHAFSTNIYWFNKDDGNNSINQTEEQFDYVVVVLDSRIGELTGWMGARGYSDAWDGLNVWSHMGYPGDLNSGSRPSWQSPFAVDGSDGESDSHEAIMHKADVFPGQSGGPLFAWWDGDVGPRAVATQSWQNSSTNGASGGGDLDELVVRARSDFP